MPQILKACFCDSLRPKRQSVPRLWFPWRYKRANNIVAIHFSTLNFKFSSEHLLVLYVHKKNLGSACKNIIINEIKYFSYYSNQNRGKLPGITATVSRHSNILQSTNHPPSHLLQRDRQSHSITCGMKGDFGLIKYFCSYIEAKRHFPSNMSKLIFYTIGWLALCSAIFIPGKAQVLILQSLSGLQDQSGHEKVKKNLHPLTHWIESRPSSLWPSALQLNLPEDFKIDSHTVQPALKGDFSFINFFFLTLKQRDTSQVIKVSLLFTP